MADFLPWDPALPFSAEQRGGDQNWWNHGCPPGYFAEFVSPTFVSPEGVAGTDYGNPASRVVCRLMTTTTPQTIVDETGPTMTDALQNFNDALRQTAGQLSTSVFQGIGASLPWILGAAVLFLYLNSKQR